MALLSIPVMLNTNQAQEEKHIDFAIRWSHTIGPWDIGLSHFYGTSRDPRLLPQVDASGRVELIPFL